MATYDDDEENDYLPTGNRRCRATRRNGAGRCGQMALRDQWLCRLHGGAIERNLRAAEQKALERDARKLLRQWDPNPEPVTDPVAELARLAGQSAALKDMAFRAAEPHDACDCCGREETDASAIMAFSLLAKNLTTQLTSLDKIGLRDKILAHNEAALLVLLAALNDALTEQFPDVDLARVQLQERFRDRVAYWEQHASELTGPVLTQSRGGGTVVLSPDAVTGTVLDADDDWL